MGTKNAPEMHQVHGQLLHVGYEYDEGLLLDLYGSVDEDGCHVESIAVTGTTIEISQLFRGRQMENMSLWLSLKDGGPAQREWAERHRQHASGYSG